MHIKEGSSSHRNHTLQSNTIMQYIQRYKLNEKVIKEKKGHFQIQATQIPPVEEKKMH